MPFLGDDPPDRAAAGKETSDRAGSMSKGRGSMPWRQTVVKSDQIETEKLAEQAYELRYSDGPTAYALATEAFRRARESQHPRGVIRALLALSAAGVHTSAPHTAEHLAAAAALLELEPDPVGQARALVCEALLARRQAEYSRSMRLLMEAREAFRAQEDRHAEADVIRVIGSLHALTGDFVAAIASHEESRAMCEELNDLPGLAHCAHDLGVSLFEFREFESSQKCHEEALARYRSTRGASGERRALLALGACHREQGRESVAERRLRECIASARESGDHLPEARGLFYLGMLHLDRAAWDVARTTFGEAEAISRTFGERRTEIGAIVGGGRALLGLGELDAAEQRLTAALQAAEASGLQRVIAEAHEALAELYERAHDFEAALRHFKAQREVREHIQRVGAHLRAGHQRTLAQMRRKQHATELQVLKAQLQPHFLFNALNSLSALIGVDDGEARKMVAQLGDLLRLALDQSTDQRTDLASEIAFLSAYLELEKTRFGPAFSYTIEVEPDLGAVIVPHLLLQPLAENAIRHGFAGRRQGGVLEVLVTRAADDQLLLSVRDNGAGLARGWNREDAGFGLRNTRVRLQRLYGPHHEFHVGEHEGGGTRVDIRVPIFP
jgi:tetratricopeptide (TPR) repeat protein